jgi:hypothetical protein
MRSRKALLGKISLKNGKDQQKSDQENMARS